jgi:hypothetical protein
MSINSVIFHYASVGDYIFLIAIVVASIIQSIAQNKKKKALEAIAQKNDRESDRQYEDLTEETTENTASSDRPLDTIFDSFERILIPEIDQANYNWGDDYAEAVTVEKNENDSNEAINIPEEKYMPVYEVQKVMPIPSQSSVYYPKVSYRSKIRAEFTLKKAVVFSEILNRKYS